MDKIDYEFVSWETAHEHSRRLSEIVIGSGFKPDIIVGLARGGWVPARNVCDFLGVKDLISLKMEHWGEIATKDGKAKLKYPLNVKLDGKMVLIVDDCADTGESLKLAKEHIEELGAEQVKTATMHVFDTTPKENVPDFFAEKLTYRWMMYDWTRTEDMIGLAAKVLDNKGGRSAEELVSDFEEHFGLKPGKEDLEAFLKEGERRGKIIRNGNVFLTKGVKK